MRELSRVGQKVSCAGQAIYDTCADFIAATPRCDQGVDKPEDMDQVLIEDVHEAIRDLVQIMKIYDSKNKISKIIVSSLFKRRQDEAEAAVNVAISRLQVSNSLTWMCV